MKRLKDKIINDPKVRKKLAWESHYYFFHIYFSEHITYPTAPFHEELFRISENIKSQFDEVVTFRGSAKTTIFSMSLPIWSILGKHQLKHIVLISRTQGQSRQLLMNIRSELENNELLKRDFNLKIDYQEEWSVSSLVLSQFGARISTYSVGESIRGVKHRQYRPQLIICDDIEDLSSVKTKESRDKTFNFISGEVIPAGDMDTKIILVGNLLHSDSVMMRYKELIENKKLDGSYHFYPLLNDNGIIVWPGKFTNQKSIATLQSKVGNIKTFQREYLLKIVSEEDQIVLPEWIKYYEELPLHRTDMQYIALGVDLAISQKDTADKTAFVCAYIYGAEENLAVYISPYIMNRRLTFLETQQELQKIVKSIGDKSSIQIYIEDVGYQRAAIEELKKKNYQVEGISVFQSSKADRLSVAASLLQNGKVYFPQGSDAQTLIQQLTYFGTEKYDDLADAFSLLMQKIIEKDKKYTGPFKMKGFRRPSVNYRTSTSNFRRIYGD